MIEISKRTYDNKYIVSQQMYDPCADLSVFEGDEIPEYIQQRWVVVAVKNSYKAAETFVQRVKKRQEKNGTNEPISN